MKAVRCDQQARQLMAVPSVGPIIASTVLAKVSDARMFRSGRDFASKLGIVLEQADETAFWLDLLAESRIVPPEKLDLIRKETEELIAIVAASRITAMGRMKSGAGRS